MVASNPLFRGIWTIKRLRATVINDIWPLLLFYGGVATMVYCVTTFTSTSLAIDSVLLGVLGLVLGLVISFRTSSAYERYSEGRALWAVIHTCCRNTAQIIWVNVPVKRQNMTEMQCIIEKKSIINLIQAFPVALKHHLRAEGGIYYEDLYPLVSFLPRYGSKNPSAHGDGDLLPLWCQSEEEGHKMPHPGQSSSSVSSKASSKSNGYGYLPKVDVHRPLQPARMPPKESIFDIMPIFGFIPWIGEKISAGAEELAENVGVKQRSLFGRKKRLPPPDTNVPLEIALYLTSYLNYIISNGLLQLPVAYNVAESIFNLQATMSNMERIKTTPLPFAYQAHLRMSLWLYLFFLPFQVYSTLGWIVIPGTVFAAFLMLGFLEIGHEIEDPFGYDHNDLDTDAFVLAIQRELAELTVHDSQDPLRNVFSNWNQPFAPADRRTATQLTKQAEYVHDKHQGVEQGMDSVRRTLLNGWKEIEDKTRRKNFY